MKTLTVLWAVAAMSLLHGPGTTAVEPPNWVCPCQRAVWREYNDPAHVPLTIDVALQLSISAFAFRKDQRDAFVDVVSSAAKIQPHRVEITSVEDVKASALADGVHVNFTITVPGADEKLVAPMLATLTMDPMPNGFADRLAEKGLPTLIAVVNACAAWPSVHVCVCGEPAACSSGSSCPFFDASVVRYPSSYSYAATYETRSLTPVAGYEHGTSMFTTMDISSTISSSNIYAGGVLGPDGLIYFVPYHANNIGILDASSSSFSTLDISSTISSGYKYNGGVLGPDGLIYFVPADANNIGILDASSSSFSTLDISNSISSSSKYRGGVLGPDGLIYFVPSNADNIGILNPSSSSFSTLDMANKYYAGGVLGPDGLIYFVPDNANNIGMLNLTNKNPCYEAGSCMPEAWSSLLSPHFNKF